jgi:hypothetical protein
MPQRTFLALNTTPWALEIWAARDVPSLLALPTIQGACGPTSQDISPNMIVLLVPSEMSPTPILLAGKMTPLIAVPPEPPERGMHTYCK